MITCIPGFLECAQRLLPDYSQWFYAVQKWISASNEQIHLIINGRKTNDGSKRESLKDSLITWWISSCELQRGRNEITVWLSESDHDAYLKSLAVERGLTVASQSLELTSSSPRGTMNLSLTYARDARFDSQRKCWHLKPDGTLTFYLDLPQAGDLDLTLHLLREPNEASDWEQDLIDLVEEVHDAVQRRRKQLRDQARRLQEQGDPRYREVDQDLAQLQEYHHFHTQRLEPALRQSPTSSGNNSRGRKPRSPQVSNPLPQTATNLPFSTAPAARTSTPVKGAASGWGVNGMIFLILTIAMVAFGAAVLPGLLNNAGGASTDYDRLLAFAPANSQFVAGMDLKQQRQQPEVKAMVDQSMKRLVDIFPASSPLVNLIKKTDRLIMASTIRNGLEGVMVLETTSSFEQEEIQRLARQWKGQRGEASGISYYSFQTTDLMLGAGRATRKLFLAMPTDQILVVAFVSPGEIAGILSRHGQAPRVSDRMMSQIRKVAKAPAWEIFLIEEEMKRGLAVTMPEARSVEAISLWSELKQGQLHLNLAINCKEQKAAEKISSALRELWTTMGKPTAQGWLRNLKGRRSPGEQALVQVGGEITNSLAIRQVGSDARVSLKLSLQSLSRLDATLFEKLMPIAKQFQGLKPG